MGMASVHRAPARVRPAAWAWSGSPPAPHRRGTATAS